MTAGSPSTRASSDTAPVAWERDGHGYESHLPSPLARTGFHLLTRVLSRSDACDGEGIVRMRAHSLIVFLFCGLEATEPGALSLYTSRLGLQVPGLDV